LPGNKAVYFKLENQWGESDWTWDNISYEPIMYYYISGYIRDGNNQSIGAVTITGFPNGSTETDVNGYYYVDQIISTWSGTITSSKSGYNFTPSSKTFNGLTGNTTQNFTAISNVSYSWHMGDYGVCNDTCGGGQKTRAVECRRNDGQIMPDSYCSGTKPNEVSYDCPELGPSRLNNVLNGEAYTPNN